jgi:hypothetical protein
MGIGVTLRRDEHADDHADDQAIALILIGHFVHALRLLARKKPQ